MKVMIKLIYFIADIGIHFQSIVIYLGLRCEDWLVGLPPTRVQLPPLPGPPGLVCLIIWQEDPDSLAEAEKGRTVGSAPSLCRTWRNTDDLRRL